MAINLPKIKPNVTCKTGRQTPSDPKEKEGVEPGTGIGGAQNIPYHRSWCQRRELCPSVRLGTLSPGTLTGCHWRIASSAFTLKLLGFPPHCLLYFTSMNQLDLEIKIRRDTEAKLLAGLTVSRNFFFLQTGRTNW